jgi:selenocysteine lyase/cysteine desulfurase
MDIGMTQIANAEETLTAYALQQLQTVPGLVLYGESDWLRSDERVGVIPFNLTGIPHGLVAAILGYEGGIGVRNGCFCAHPYVVHLLKLSNSEQQAWRTEILRGDKSAMPGMVRISFGCHNTHAHVDKLVGMLHRIARGDYLGNYQVDSAGNYSLVGYIEQWEEYFSFAQN